MNPPPPDAPPEPRATLAEVAARVGEALRERCRVRPGVAIVAACSGGADSVALVHALAVAGGGHPLRVAFVDHGLRAVEAERAAAEAAARAVGATFDGLRVDVAEGPGLQARARAARWSALLGLDPDALVATGHTATDRAETVLMRLLRGAGPRGLAALPWRDGRRIRPLLGASRAEVRALGLPFVDDPSNAGRAYLRNRVRHDIVPLLVRESPTLEASLSALADMLRAERDLLDALVARLDLGALDLRGLDPAAIEALLHARASAADEAPPGRAALRAWARALAAGDDGSYPLGQGLVGLARAGRPGLRRAVDPRTRVVAWGPGTYRLAHSSLEVLAVHSTDARVPAHDPVSSAFLAATDVVWPLALERDPAGGPASVDLTTGLRRAPYRVVDGRGDPLLPRPGARSEAHGDARGEAARPSVEGGIAGVLLTLHLDMTPPDHTDVVARAIRKLPLER